MRFHLTSADRAKSLAKGLKAAAAGYGISPSLSVSQAAVAVALGYKSFAELTAATDRKANPPSPFDESLPPSEAAARQARQARAYNEILGLSLRDSTHLALTTSLTSASRISDALAERLAVEFEAHHRDTPLAEHPNFSEQERLALSGDRASRRRPALLVPDDLADRRRALGIVVHPDGTVSLALTAAHWRLYADMEGASQVADALNRAVEDAVRGGRSITKAAWEVMRRHSRHGATDTVAVDALGWVVEAIEGFDNSFDADMAEIEGSAHPVGPSLRP